MLRNALLLIVLFFGSLGVAAEALKVGISTDYPPLAYKQEGRIVGIEADNATAVGAILGRKMTMVEMPFEKLIPALQTG